MSLRWPLVALEMGAGAHCARTGVWSTLAALKEQILDALAPRTAEQGKETVGEVFSQDRVQQRLVKQMVEVRKVSRKGRVEQLFGFPEPQMMVQVVDVPKIVVELAGSFVEAASSWPGERHDQRRRCSSRGACWSSSASWDLTVRPSL